MFPFVDRQESGQSKEQTKAMEMKAGQEYGVELR